MENLLEQTSAILFLHFTHAERFSRYLFRDHFREKRKNNRRIKNATRAAKIRIDIFPLARSSLSLSLLPLPFVCQSRTQSNLQHFLILLIPDGRVKITFVSAIKIMIK